MPHVLQTLCLRYESTLTQQKPMTEMYTIRKRGCTNAKFTAYRKKYAKVYPKNILYRNRHNCMELKS